MRHLLLAITVCCSASWAVEPGGPMFVKQIEPTPLLKAPKKKAAKLKDLSCGDQLVWNGADKKDPNYQSVTTADGKKGFVLLEQLSDTEIPFAKCGYTKGF